MAEREVVTIDGQGRVEPLPSVITVAAIVYALHTFAIVVGVIGAATVIGSFLGSIPSIAAVVLNYIKRGDARGTWAESHYRWQIRTFWYALLWAVIATIFIFTVVLAVIGFPMLIALSIWLIYRIARGWLRLGDHKPMYV